ncbi:MAG: hypothetical protein U0Y96_07925 [Candidatus Kapaibacterium sp.]
MKYIFIFCCIMYVTNAQQVIKARKYFQIGACKSNTTLYVTITNLKDQTISVPMLIENQSSVITRNTFFSTDAWSIQKDTLLINSTYPLVILPHRKGDRDYSLCESGDTTLVKKPKYETLLKYECSSHQFYVEDSSILQTVHWLQIIHKDAKIYTIHLGECYEAK